MADGTAHYAEKVGDTQQLLSINVDVFNSFFMSLNHLNFLLCCFCSQSLLQKCFVAFASGYSSLHVCSIVFFGKISIHYFRMSCFACIRSVSGVFCVFLTWLIFFGFFLTVLLSIVCCCLLTVVSFHCVVVFFLFLSAFAYCSCSFIFSSNLLFYPVFMYLFGFLSRTPSSSLNDFFSA